MKKVGLLLFFITFLFFSITLVSADTNSVYCTSGCNACPNTGQHVYTRYVSSTYALNCYCKDRATCAEWTWSNPPGPKCNAAADSNWDCKSKVCSGSSVICRDGCGTVTRTQTNCGSNYCDSWGSNVCSGGNVVHSRTCYNRGCSSGACYSNSYTDTQIVQNCGTLGCSGGVCTTCATHASSACDSGDVYWYDSCGTKEQIKEDCQYGCSSGACLTPNAYWANMNDEEITGADLNDYVKLVFSSAGVQGVNIDFEVRKDIPFWFDSEVAGSTGAYTTWKANAEGNYYFRARVNGNNVDSGNLAVSATEDDSQMELNVLSPRCGSDMNKGDIADVAVEALDEDDLITGVVDFGDGINQQVGNGVISVQHVFNIAGNIQVIANATNTRSYKTRTISNIMVIDTAINGHYLAACIDEPKDLTHLTENIVVFNATSTRGIDFVSATQTRNEISKSGMSFKWAYSDENISPAGEELEASSIKYHTYSGLNSTAYLFEREFALAGNNWATLEVELI